MLLRFPTSQAEARECADAGAVPVGGATLVWADWQEHGFPGLAMSLRDLPEANALGPDRVGAAVTLDRVGAAVPHALRQAAAAVGNPMVRRTATVGGNLAGSGPRCLLPALRVLRTRALVLGRRGLAETDLDRSLAERRLLVGLRWTEPVTSACRKLRAHPDGPPPVVAVALHAPREGSAQVRVAVRVGRELLTAVTDTDGGPVAVLRALRETPLAELPRDVRDVLADQVAEVLAGAAAR
ncbi:FAD binding domain-containing protein [Streptomyces sp. MUM 203J]|uniref:FAD binding domain-containing protein n=1 Tax=Streptomyces sp. MUM 203J TaxID=2791990 RepID=UPI001F03FE1F|nr:FAD binding domain-containing protein [Streptomyces sp. MUM 203J]MCH0539683.1 FAD binding domain-containing protein [Streptomyces sp. MUM 203J]